LKEKIRNKAVKDIKAKFDGTFTSIMGIYKRLRYYKITSQEWREILIDSGVETYTKKNKFAGNAPDSKVTPEMRRLYAMVLFASEYKKLNESDITNIMKIVRDIGA